MDFIEGIGATVHQQAMAEERSKWRNEEITSLRQQLAEAKKDAERYRWLRNQSMHENWHAPCVVLGTPDGESFPFLCEEMLDSAIDAAIAKEKS